VSLVTRDRLLHAAFLGALAACTAPPQATVPLVGPTRDVAALAGHWDGAYSSVQTGRSGSVSFTLISEPDSAFGDVVMIPRGFGRPLQAWTGATPTAPGVEPARATVLTISFVRVTEGRVSGTLKPYADPETGVQLFTTFDGRLDGDVIAGTFTTRSAGAADSITGEWKVTRRKP
jgi:hypothetical protein